MANTIELPNLKFFQWQRPNAANPRLSVPLNLNDDEVEVSSPPLDENGDVITGDFIFGVRNSAGYVENIYVPPGEVSTDGLTFTNVVRGINTTGLDYNTTVPELVAEHGQDSPVFCNVTAVYESILAACLRGQSIRTNGVNFIQGTGNAETVTVSRDDGTVRGWLRFDNGTQNVQFSNDGSAWINLSPGGANSLIAITAADTSPGYLDDKLDVTSNNPVLSVQKNVLNPGGGEVLELEYDVDSTDTSSGVGDAGKLVELDAGGKISVSMLGTPNIKIYGRNSYGDNTSRYDITNPSGNTFRYTYDGTGADPFIGTHSMIIGQTIDIISSVFNAANTGTFTITNVGNNFFEVTNPNGVPQNDVARGTGRIGSPNEWIKPSRLSHILVEVWGSGGAGGLGNGVRRAGGGGGGAYNFKEFLNDELGANIALTIGLPVRSVANGSTSGPDTPGQRSAFGALLEAFGGGSGGENPTNHLIGGGGGGILSIGVNGIGSTGVKGGNPVFLRSLPSPSIYGGGDSGENSIYGGGGGSNAVNTSSLPGDSVYGGAGGGATTGSANTNGGTSIYGGNGSNGFFNADSSLSGNSAFMPGGGGGGTILGGNLTPGVSRTGWSGSGMIKITEYLK